MELRRFLPAPLPVLVSLLIPLAGNLQASPLLTIGNDLNVFFNGSASVGYDTNIALDDSDEIADVFMRASSAIEWNYGHGNANLKILLGANAIAYLDESDFDSTTGFVELDGSYKGARSSFVFHGSTQDLESNTSNINVVRELIRRRIHSFDFKGSYELTEKVEITSGFDVRVLDYHNFRNIFKDEKRYGIPFNIYYAYSPKLDISTGYHYTHTNVSGGNNRNDHFFNVGFRGEIAPKLEGALKTGYRYRSISDASDTSTFGLESDIIWRFSELTAFALGANRDFDTGGRGESLKITGVEFKVIHTLNALISAEALMGYKNYDYDNGRVDDNCSAGMTLSYRPNDYLSFGFNYMFLDNDSNLVGASYRGHRILCTVAVRY